ncbi:DUF2244 domain-containing protein [Polynucleobacter sp.]|jgi:uncharacterized membrane protein|uniref:DUF2244 domain-containing protein n=1 Tax=Polynucleobacter sp. TaxID=2029855 RepID=UPI003015A1AC
MRTWLMKRNCSFSPKQVGLFYLSIVSFSLLVAGYFWLLGAWMILIFTSLALLVLTIALYVYSRHALDYEKITITGKQLIVEKSWGGKVQIEEFNTIWTKLYCGGTGRHRLALKSSTKEVPIGFFVVMNEQEQFEKELKSYLGL